MPTKANAPIQANFSLPKRNSVIVAALRTTITTSIEFKILQIASGG